VVGLCVERSVEMVIGLLGILKAGGAYLPLDPHYPAERLKFMLADAAAAVLVTQSDLEALLPRGGAAAPVVVRLDADWRRSRAPRGIRPRSRSIRKTPPTSSTPQDQPVPQKASS
jgi:non-ribosomal peptide synthetase component F